MTDVLILISACTAASFIQRVSGFGFGIFIMTILPLLMPSYGEATTLSGILSSLQSLYVLASLWKHVKWKRLLPILAAFIVSSYIAIQFVSYVSDTNLKQILGGVLIIMSIYFLFISERISIRPTTTMQFSMGSLSGILGGLFAMQGPPAVLYFIASERDKTKYMSMTQGYFFIGNIAMTLFRAGEGYLTHDVGMGTLYASAGIVIGTLIGKFVFDKISAPLLRKIVYAYMAASGMYALLA
jgi:uncharacterized membrane protein YfcA